MYVSPYFASIDLGSNSFHMLIARIDNGKLEVIDREKEMVQIARGLQADGTLSEASKARALECLNRFSERLRDIPQEQIRAVGTKTLRSAQNSNVFLRHAEAELGCPIQIITGFEEARLVYSGLCHSISNDQLQRLVIDIGGGSTEFIIGKDEEPELLESLSLGCVAFTNNFFSKPKQTFSESMDLAYLAACAEIDEIRKPYLKHGWDISFGTSGTMRAIAEVLSEKDSGALITQSSLNELYNSVKSSGELPSNSLPKLRREVLPAGIAILKAIFDELKIKQIRVSDATLKDGLIYDTIGRFSDNDTRANTIEKLSKRYNIDTEQAERVKATTLLLWRAIKDGSPNLYGVPRTKILGWAALLHEIGLSISHSGFHHHGYYLLRHSDLAGFGRYEQMILANLVRSHRKKINPEHLSELDQKAQLAIIPPLLCLRLASRANRRRDDTELNLDLKATDSGYQLSFSQDWLAANPMTAAGFQKEVEILAQLGINLSLNGH